MSYNVTVWSKSKVNKKLRAIFSLSKRTREGFFLYNPEIKHIIEPIIEMSLEH